MLCFLMVGFAVLPTSAAFSSFYIFGDSISSTTNNPGDQISYYSTNGLRWSNGRVWVEVLAQRQGMVCESNKNWSYYGHNSTNLISATASFVAPPDVSNALVVVWVNNADFVDHMTYIYPSLNPTTWSNAINASLTNHVRAITNLYAKGVRTLIMPNAVDITKIPQYNLIASASEKSFIRQRAANFNAGFVAVTTNLMTTLPGLKIYVPDIFSLLDDVVAHAANYGLTNALYFGQSIDALGDPALADKSLNGPGRNYIFWDYQAPTAKFHAVIADYIQQLVSPVHIDDITATAGNSQIVIANTPVGRNGFVEGSTNFVNWTTAQTITSSNATQTVAVPATALQEFYRLRFPFSWTWP